MMRLSPTSTASRGSVVALAALAVLVGVGGGAAAVELRASSTPVQAAPSQLAIVPTITTAPRTDGFDPASCLAPAGTSPATGAPQTDDEATGQTVVSFTIPPLTQVTVDAQGTPLTVATNTGQAPCITDAFVQVRPDGTTAPAAADVRDAVLRLHLGEDWAPGVPRPLPAQR